MLPGKSWSPKTARETRSPHSPITPTRAIFCIWYSIGTGWLFQWTRGCDCNACGRPTNVNWSRVEEFRSEISLLQQALSPPTKGSNSYYSTDTKYPLAACGKYFALGEVTIWFPWAPGKAAACFSSLAPLVTSLAKQGIMLNSRDCPMDPISARGHWLGRRGKKWEDPSPEDPSMNSQATHSLYHGGIWYVGFLKDF